MADLPSSAPVPARDEYLARLAHARDQIAVIAVAHRKMVWLRTALFVLAGGCLLFGYGGDAFRTLLIGLGWLFAVGFMVAIVRHEHLRLKRLHHQSDERLFEHLLARLDRNWEKLPEAELLDQYKHLMYAHDLDIGGHASLLSYIQLAGTGPGRRTLQAWLATPTFGPVVEERQRAVRQLAPERELRLEVIKTVRASVTTSNESYGLPDWAQSPNWLKAHPVANVLSFVGPGLVVVGLLGLGLAAILQNRLLLNISGIILAAGFVNNILVTIFWGSWIHDLFLKVTGEHRAVYQFAAVFESFANLPQDGGLLDSIRVAAVEPPNSAKSGFQQLRRLVLFANLQRDVLMYALYLLLQLCFLWDFRVLYLLEKWKSRFGASVQGWFEALGQCEAIICGATLADENPDWAFPEANHQDAQVALSTSHMGHPLLSERARVVNDVELLASKPLMVVTGSNMAGKSTFLRSVGLNLLLARIGGPVCAARFSAPFYELATSIRIQDSLRDGVSFFMAELKRLKAVVDLADKHACGDPQTGQRVPIFFLLDEILQGTNSTERQIAVASVLEQLLASRAVGMVSTHDLDLASADEVRDVSQVVHFREYFEDVDGAEVMRFDYKMRPGPTPTTNALKLLRLVGLK